jgi:hypothetical protein
MSTIVDQHWNRHYRALKETTTMPLTIGLPEPATPDPFDPEVLRVKAPVVSRNEARKIAQAAWAAETERLRRVEELVDEALEEPVEEPEAPKFVKIAAHGISCEVAIILVTPEIAERYLEGQRRNRTLRRRQIEFLVRELQRGEWKFNGETLILDEDGQMLDGQHRCHSCIKSGVPFLTLVVRNISHKARDRIDTGSKRTNGDILGMEGVTSPQLAAAVVAKLLQQRHNGDWWEANMRPSGHEVSSNLEEFPGIHQHFSVGKDLARQLGGGTSLWVVARYLTFQIDEPTARLFWEKVVTGIGLEPGDPELRLRQRLLDTRLAAGKIELMPKFYGGLIAMAWNYRRRNRPIQQLKGLYGDEPVPALI